MSESYNCQRFSHICKNKFHDVDDSNDDSDDDAFNARKVCNDIVEPNIDIDDYHDSDGHVCDTRRFHCNVE